MIIQHSPSCLFVPVLGLLRKFIASNQAVHVQYFSYCILPAAIMVAVHIVLFSHLKLTPLNY